MAFDAMLIAETRLAESLGAFFAPLNAPIRIPELTFSDKIFQNIDLRTGGGEWPILYAFPAQDILIITTNESTLKELVSRLSISGGR